MTRLVPAATLAAFRGSPATMVAVAQLTVQLGPERNYYLSTRDDDYFARAFGGSAATASVVYVPFGLGSWGSVSQELDLLERTVSTGQMSLQVPLNSYTRDMVANYRIHGSALNLYIGTPEMTALSDHFREIADYVVVDWSVKGASLELDCRDMRDSGRDLKTPAWTLPRNPLSAANEFNGQNDTPLGADDASLQPGVAGNESIGNLMISFPQRTAYSQVVSGSFRPVPATEFNRSASFGNTEQTPEEDVSSLVSQMMRYLRGSLTVDTSTGRPKFLPLDLNRSVDFVLTPDLYSGFELESAATEIRNQLTLQLYNPESASEPYEGPVLIDGVDVASEMGIKIPGETNPDLFVRDYRMEFVRGGFVWTDWTFLTERESASSPSIPRFRLDATATAMNIKRPEVCGFSGSSQWANSGRTRRAIPPISSGAQQPTTNQQLSAAYPGCWYMESFNPYPSGVVPPELMLVTGLSVPTTFTVPSRNSVTPGATQTDTNSVDAWQLNGKTFAHYRYMVASLTRGALGTTAQTRQVDFWGSSPVASAGIWDLTIPYRVARQLFQRHSYGVPVCSLTVPRWLGMQMQIGDVVALNGERRFVRFGRALGAGDTNGTGVEDIFEIVSIAPRLSEHKISLAWLRGSGTVTLTEPGSATDRQRTESVPGDNETSGETGYNWEDSWFVPEANATTDGGTLTDNALGPDINRHLGPVDQLITVDLRVVTRYPNQNEDDRSFGLPTARFYRYFAELYYSASGGTLTLIAETLTLRNGQSSLGGTNTQTTALGISGFTLSLDCSQSGYTARTDWAVFGWVRGYVV